MDIKEIVMAEIQKRNPFRLASIVEWLEENRELIEATDAVQITLHVKKQASGYDNVEGTVLHIVKKKQSVL